MRSLTGAEQSTANLSKSLVMKMLAAALLLLAAVGRAAAQIPDVVILLDENTFEHHTQASSGQTAGHW